MGILEEDVARVREATDMIALVSEHVALRRVGRSWVGLCPFHAEKSPSFSVNPELGVFYCFGCQVKGDAITFLREAEHLDFVGAVEALASRASIALRYDDEAVSRRRGQLSRLHDALEAAIDWYHQRLRSAPDAGAARGYLRSRDYDTEVVSTYRLGWAPAGWDLLARAGVAGEKELIDTGLAFRNDRGRLTDSFRGRVIFPIFDAAGRPVGLGGRILPGGNGPKYKNTQGTAVYDKGRVLYGLNWAKASVVNKERVVVCEGYTDVIGLQRAGVEEAVATCGTALAEGHVKLLSGFAKRIVLAYDADQAGQAAADRLYGWEERFGADIAVAALPPGADPADLARTDPDALKRAVEEAKPVLAFRLDRLFAAGDLRSVEGRARTAGVAMDAISAHPNALVRDQYLMQVADRCHLEPAQLRDRAKSAGAQSQVSDAPGRRGPGSEAADSSRGRSGGPAGSRAPRAPIPAPEMEALRLAVQRPAETEGRLPPYLFADERARSAIALLARCGGFHAAMEEAGPDLADLLGRLAVDTSEEDTDDVVVRLLERAATGALAELEREGRRTTGDPRYVVEATAWLRWALEDLRLRTADVRPEGEIEAQLLAFLADRYADRNDQGGAGE